MDIATIQRLAASLTEVMQLCDRVPGEISLIFRHDHTVSIMSGSSVIARGNVASVVGQLETLATGKETP
jgi:hypothetical protein